MAGEECSFWLKIMPREVWIIPEPATPVPLGGRVTLPGHQRCWPSFLELLGLAQRQEQGSNPRGDNHPAVCLSPGAQVNHPAVCHSPGWVFTMYTA